MSESVRRLWGFIRDLANKRLSELDPQEGLEGASSSDFDLISLPSEPVACEKTLHSPARVLGTLDITNPLEYFFKIPYTKKFYVVFEAAPEQQEGIYVDYQSYRRAVHEPLVPLEGQRKIAFQPGSESRPYKTLEEAVKAYLDRKPKSLGIKILR